MLLPRIAEQEMRPLREMFPREWWSILRGSCQRLSKEFVTMKFSIIEEGFWGGSGPGLCLLNEIGNAPHPRSQSLFDLFGGDVRSILEWPLLRVGNVPITLVFLIKCLVFLTLLTLFSRACRKFLRDRILVHTSMAKGQQYALVRIFGYLIFLFGLIIGLDSAGLNLRSLLVIAGALGLGVGFGMQNIVANFVAGLVLLWERPVKLGDIITVGSTHGEVVRIGGRSTWVRTGDNEVIIVPNTEFINFHVINRTGNDRRVRFTLRLGVSYSSDPEKVRALLVEIAGRHPDVLSDPPPEVVLAGFGDSTLDFMLYVWTETRTETGNLFKSEIYFDILKSFRENNIELPFPQRDLHLRSADVPIMIGNQEGPIIRRGGKPATVA